jgi:tripartite-type tricarboxylate transporter receptor subunit TctC
MGTSVAVIQKLQQAAAASIARPELRARIEDLGAVPLGNAPAAFAEEIRAEFSKWQRVAKLGKISLENS